MWYKIIKQPLIVDAAILTSLSYLSALLMEQVKPGFFSNTVDITWLLFLALTFIVVVLVLRPTYKADHWIKLYYLIWCLALALLFVKLVTKWLEVSFWLTGVVVIGVIGLLAWVSTHYQDKPSTSHKKH